MLVEDIDAARAVSCRWNGLTWKELGIECVEHSQGPDGVPGEQVSRFEYDAYFKVELPFSSYDFIVLYLLTIVHLNRFPLDRARLYVCVTASSIIRGIVVCA